MLLSLHRLAPAILLPIVFAAATAKAQTSPRRLTAEIAGLTKGGAGAGTSGVGGIQTTVLSGDPTKAGPYTIEIRVPAHTQIAAHRHRDDRSAVVVSGTWYFGYGPKALSANTKATGSGSFYTEPRDTPHFAETRDDAAVVYITGVGPTDTRDVDGLADPRRSPISSANKQGRLP